MPQMSYMTPPNAKSNKRYNLTIFLERRKTRNIWQTALIAVMPILDLAIYYWV